MDLRESWKHYKEYTVCNYSILPEDLKKQGKQVIFPPQSILALKGDFPEYIYFIQSGHAQGQRSNLNGSEYVYFHLDKSNGNVGLLEVFSGKDQYVATLICVTEVVAVRIASSVFFNYVMQDTDMLRRCLFLVSSDLYRSSNKDGIYYYMNGIDRVRSYLINYYTAHKAEAAEPLAVHAEYQDIAAELGISIRTVGRSLQYLRENEEILSSHRKIILTQVEYERLLANVLP